jgi:putative transposase
MIWAHMLAYITGTVDQELLLRNEYLAAENRILRAQIKGRLRLSDAEKATLAEIAHGLGAKLWKKWRRQLSRIRFWFGTESSSLTSSTDRGFANPRVAPEDEETERLVVRMAKENPGWGYDRIVGALANLGHRLSDQTVGNILRRHDIPPAPLRKRATSWKDFIRAHLAVLAATDFFTVEMLTLKR